MVREVEPESVATLPVGAVLALVEAEVVRVPGKGVFVAGRALAAIRLGDLVAVGGASGYFAGRVGAVEAGGLPTGAVQPGEEAGLYLAMSGRCPVETGASLYVLPGE